MGRRHQIDIFRTLCDQLLHHSPQPGCIHRLPHCAAGDRPILAIFAAQSAAAKENGTAAAFSCQCRLFPFVEHGLCHQCRAGTAAKAGLSGGSVDTAGSGAKLAVYIIHFLTSFYPLYHDFCPFSILLLYPTTILC